MEAQHRAGPDHQRLLERARARLAGDHDAERAGVRRLAHAQSERAQEAGVLLECGGGVPAGRRVR